MIKDMTSGNPTKLLLQFSVPLLIGNIFQQFYNMADTAIVGRTLGDEALAAVGSTGAVMFLVFGFFFGLTNGLAVITAQRFGAGDYDGVRRSVTTSTYLCTLITVAMTVLCVLLCRPMLEWMNTPENIIENAYSYLIVIFGGTWTIVFYGMISSIIRALGDSITPLVFLIIASILNIVLDYVFILSFRSGVAGAGWATVISQAVSGFLCLFYVGRKFPILKLKRSDWTPDIPFSLEHLRVAVPMALQFSITAVGVVILQTVLNSFGSVYIAAYTVAAKIEQVAIQPLFSFSIAMATFTAQNFGAGNLERIRQGLRKCSAITILFSICIGIFLIVFAAPLTRLFLKTEHPETLQEIVHGSQIFLNTSASCYIILGMLLIYRNVLQGMGHSFIPMMAGAAELVLRIIGALLLARYLGYLGVCLSNPLAWVGAVLMLWIDYLLVMRTLRKRQINPKQPLTFQDVPLS